MSTRTSSSSTTTTPTGAQAQALASASAKPAVADIEGDLGPAEKRRRARTLSRKQMAREHRKQRARGEVVDVVEYWRPQTRSECLEMERPCLFVSCRFHLFLDVNPETGSLKENFPGKEPWELEETCALDVADRGGITLEEVGTIMNLTRERIRQVEVRGLEKLKEVPESEGGVAVYIDWDPYDSSVDY
ncbi:MAG: sigma factor-like helix-turn-helix DNA-binding protein [Deltaproteobacteria bacterium]|nr:sigma factor-like helix-turn-helix DNA-binding protein [Deltaproteobacteria bacterium]